MKSRSSVWFLVASLTFGAGVRVAPTQVPERANREEFQKMMEAYVVSKLQESLELSDEQYAQMVIAQKRLQDGRRSHRRERQRLLRQLKQGLDREDADADLQTVLEEIAELTDRQVAEQKKRQGAIDQILSVRQQARYRLLEVELERRLQQLMRDVRSRRQQQRPQQRRRNQ